MINKEATKKVQQAVDLAVGKKGEGGLQVAVYHQGELAVDVWGGVADQATGVAVGPATVFWLGALGKPLAATMLHIQAERGYVDYEERVARYWPEFGCFGKETATVYDALTHRLGVPMFPYNATPEAICDWDWVASEIAQSHPLHEPGARRAYASLTFGWIAGEIARRSDGKGRPFGRLIQEEICAPLGIDALWFGIPAAVEPRVANVSKPRPAAVAPARPAGVGTGRGTVPGWPPQLPLTQETFGRSDVRRSCTAFGAIGNAKSVARVFALLANLGELDGVRLLSEDRVRLFGVPAAPPSNWDIRVGLTTPKRASIGGFYLHHPEDSLTLAYGNGPGVFGYTGGVVRVIAWADPKRRLAVSMLCTLQPPVGDAFVPVANAIREALGIGG